MQKNTYPERGQAVRIHTFFFRLSASLACAALGLASSGSHAEIYKWVDANGRTHYSENKATAGKANSVEVKVKAPAPSPDQVKAAREYWQDQDRQLNEREMQRQSKKPSGPPMTPRPKSLSGGVSDSTDASKCNLARDVLSGAVQHRSGAPIDKYDLDTAKNDVRLFCH
jgi:hypothetical protein